MTTITIPKTEYELLKKKASLYEQVLKPQPEKKYKTEGYSLKRLKEFLSQDGLDLDRKTLLRLKKSLQVNPKPGAFTWLSIPSIILTFVYLT